MDVKEYCESVGNDLASWKAKMSKITEKTSALTGAEKDKAEPIVQELNSIMDDIDQRIATLASECPSEWSDDKDTIDGKISQAKDKWKQVWGALGEDEAEYGIGGA